jgi:hypothetical protein
MESRTHSKRNPTRAAEPARPGLAQRPFASASEPGAVRDMDAALSAAERFGHRLGVTFNVSSAEPGREPAAAASPAPVIQRAISKRPKQKASRAQKKQAARKKERNEERRERRTRYGRGTHGYKTKEQRRLSDKFDIHVSGDTHESEHAIGYEPLAQTTGLHRQHDARGRRLEKSAPAYQEKYAMHRAHIGTGNRLQADESGFNAQTYRRDQRRLIESGQVGNAVQLNQLGYAFIDGFQDDSLLDFNAEAADDSYDMMVQNLGQVTYGHGDKDVTVDVSPQERAEMYLARRAAKSGEWPTRDEENVARAMFGLDLLPDEEI